MAAIALFGVVAYRALPISDLPQVDYPTINVQASLPGGDPVTMASSVASPLERQFTTISGVDSMVSQSGTGSSQITLQFDLDRDIYSATVDVQTAIAAAMPLLPATMTSPPSFRRQNPSADPILQLNLTSPTVPLSVLDDYAETMIAPRIAIVNGVSQVQVQGASKYAVRVQIDPDKLHAQQIGINEVDQALQNWNVNIPTGQLFGPTSTYNIKAAGQLMNAAAFRPIIVAVSRPRADPAGPGRQRHRQHRERVQRELVLFEGRQRQTAGAARDHPAGAAPARDQYDRSDRRRPPAAAGVRVAAAAVGAPLGPAGSLPEHPQGVHRHPDHDAGDAGARRRGDFRLSPQRVGDADSRPRPAVLDPRHLRGDAGVELQPQQPLDDGADPLDRLRRRRRDRDAREHRAPYGERGAAARRPRSRARARSASRSSR